ncbi:hypothetical protein JTB14_024742 [Gonioctena quinquepunctata]|nr:hypothetical protein JTB14_024742 [Gonioctena quinquepunctata]
MGFNGKEQGGNTALKGISTTLKREGPQPTRRTQRSRLTARSKTVAGGSRFTSGSRWERSDSGRGDRGSGLGQTGPRSEGRVSELGKGCGMSARGRRDEASSSWIKAVGLGVGIPNQTAKEGNPGSGWGAGRSGSRSGSGRSEVNSRGGKSHSSSERKHSTSRGHRERSAPRPGSRESSLRPGGGASTSGSWDGRSSSRADSGKSGKPRHPKGKLNGRRFANEHLDVALIPESWTTGPGRINGLGDIPVKGVHGRNAPDS